MRCALGVYGDNKPENTNRFDAMNGAPCAWIMGTIMDNRAGWANVRWLWDDKFLGQNLKKDWRGGALPLKRWINFSIAIFPKDGNVDAAARGEYAKEWANQAQQLKAEAPRNDRGKVSVRGDWEGNIGFYWKWSDAKRAAIIASWRQRHAAFEKVAPGLFEHVWCPNYAAGGLNVESFYPGDDVVDVIGMDHYWKHQWETTNPDTAWDKIRNARFGLKWQADFADAHGKLKEASEWAIPGDTKVGRSYLQRMRQHFIDREYCAAGYWDSDKDTDGRLSDNPAGDDSRKAFVELFGATYLPAKAGGATTPPIVTPVPLPPAEAQPPAPPADPAVALLTAIHEGAWAERRRNPATPLATLEHVAWAARVRLGLVAGDAPDGQAPLPALLAIYRADVSGYDAGARAMATAWQDQAEPLLEAAGLLVESEEPDPVTPEPAAPAPAPDDTGAEMEALRRENETLRERVASTTAELVAARAALAMIRAALPPG